MAHISTELSPNFSSVSPPVTPLLDISNFCPGSPPTIHLPDIETDDVLPDTFDNSTDETKHVVNLLSGTIF